MDSRHPVAHFSVCSSPEQVGCRVEGVNSQEFCEVIDCMCPVPANKTSNSRNKEENIGKKQRPLLVPFQELQEKIKCPCR